MTKSANILVVDDDVRICNFLVLYLSKEGFNVNAVHSGAEMRRYLETESPDLVVLDLILPDEDGLELARELRANHDLGIVMLTGKTDTVEKIIGLETGADDYVAKPYDNRELLARIKSVLRRMKSSHQVQSLPPDESDQVAHFDDWTFDLSGYELISPEGKNIYLTSFEYKLLSTLILSKNRVLTRDHLMDSIAEREWNPDDRSIDVLIGKLRKKIEKDPSAPVLIKTMRGAGYKFTAQVTLTRMFE